MKELQLVDKVPRNARVVFVGINPAIRSATVGHYYAHPTNLFWRLLSESGIAPRPVTHIDDDWLATQGFGFTDVAKRPTVGAKDVSAEEYAQAPDRIQQILADVQPDVMAFVSKRAARAYLGISDAEPLQYGPSHHVGRTQVWFLPSTSGQSYADTTYAEKLEEFKRLAAHLAPKEFTAQDGTVLVATGEWRTPGPGEWFLYSGIGQPTEPIFTKTGVIHVGALSAYPILVVRRPA